MLTQNLSDRRRIVRDSVARDGLLTEYIRLVRRFKLTFPGRQPAPGSFVSVEELAILSEGEIYDLTDKLRLSFAYSWYD